MKLNFYLAGEHTWEDSNSLTVVSVQPGSEIGELDVLLKEER